MNAPDLTTRPPTVEVSGADLAATLAQIEARGGRPTGMARVSGHNALWRVSFWWPSPTQAELLETTTHEKPQPTTEL
jgi:hypothetical protein